MQSGFCSGSEKELKCIIKTPAMYSAIDNSEVLARKNIIKSVSKNDELATLRQHHFLIQHNILSLSTSANFFRRLFARIHSRSFILQHCNFFSASGTGGEPGTEESRC